MYSLNHILKSFYLDNKKSMHSVRAALAAWTTGENPSLSVWKMSAPARCSCSRITTCPFSAAKDVAVRPRSFAAFLSGLNSSNSLTNGRQPVADETTNGGAFCKAVVRLLTGAPADSSSFEMPFKSRTKA